MSDEHDDDEIHIPEPECGWENHERKAAEVLGQVEQTEEQRRAQKLLHRGVPEKDLRLMSSGQLDEGTQPMGEARAFVDDPEIRILVLSGPRGVGKTTAASWIMANAPRDRHIATDIIGPRFLDAAELSLVNRYKESELRPLKRASLLVIDDLGIEYFDEKGSFSATFDAIINARYASHLRTVMTTNLVAEEFRERYGVRTIDRIRECGRFVGVVGESLRRRQ